MFVDGVAHHKLVMIMKRSHVDMQVNPRLHTKTLSASSKQIKMRMQCEAGEDEYSEQQHM